MVSHVQSWPSYDSFQGALLSIHPAHHHWLALFRHEQWGCLGIGALLITFTFVYDFTVGPVTYSLISELSSTRLKAKTIVLARAAYNASNIFVNVMTNYQLSDTAWDWGARASFFWAGSCLISAIWGFFRLPEPKVRKRSTGGDTDADMTRDARTLN